MITEMRLRPEIRLTLHLDKYLQNILLLLLYFGGILLVNTHHTFHHVSFIINISDVPFVSMFPV